VEIDLDAARAARAEAAGEPPTVKLSGRTFTLPHELGVRFATIIADGDVEEAVRYLFNGQADAFWELDPHPEDIKAFFAGLRTVYGIDPGESSASSTSSGNGGGPSRPTSPATTKQTSGKPAMGKRRSGSAT
jgi:hypothetical protein